MNFEELKRKLHENGVKQIDGKTTEPKTYSQIKRSSLGSGANRLNSGWIRAELIIVNDADSRTKSDMDCLDLWKKLNIKPDQMLLLKKGEDLWELYDKDGNPIGDESSFIDKYEKPTVESPKQTIYYGSPGTGKSHIVENKVLDGVPECFRFRTTFHPDTDYASFVGCYKPVCKEIKPEILDLAKLQEVYDQEYKVMIKDKEKEKEKDKDKEKDSKNKTEVIAKFIQDYAESIVEAAKESSLNQVIKSLYDTGNDTYFAEMTKLVLEERKRCNCQIVYEFVPQVFTDAYVAAWKNPQKQIYLIIEEINRGNCAQIFGDLFQLLDRKNGVSEYKIKAEKDLAYYLQGVLTGESAEGIEDGKLSLPANLNIIATMNTSDQSLFPMDSAFKRRWDWKYIPTTPPTDKNKVIEIGDRKYDWKAFLNVINERIQDATRSEDKKLGFWFVKTQEGKDIISDNTFASKVIFYLWNDVFKDLGDKGNPFVSEVGGKTALTSFNSFFMMNSDGDVVVNVDAIHKFMANLGLNPIE